MSKKFGIDLSKLKPQEVSKKIWYPKVVPGRVCHIDADFLAYMVSATHDAKTLSAMEHNAEVAAEKLRLRSGAEKMVLHLTPKTSDKGGRYDIALLKEYQASRKDKVKPKYLHMVRDYMTKHLGAVDHEHCEADDGMAKAQYKAIAEGNLNLSIIATKDKDLSMVPGLHLDWDTGEIIESLQTFGHINLFRDKSAPKIRGKGWKYFWAQMLTGDPADNISGLPEYWNEEKEKWTKCGPVLADQLLQPITTNKEAYVLVRDLYRHYGEEVGFKNWRDESPVRWQDAFMSEAKLLWMRRNDNPDDVIEWFTEECI